MGIRSLMEPYDVFFIGIAVFEIFHTKVLLKLKRLAVWFAGGSNNENGKKAPKPEREVHIVSREEWGAEPPKKQAEIDLPAKYVTFSSTRTEECYNKEQCIKIIKKIQEEQMKKGMHDILPNFLIGSDGTIYEGRGWKVQGYPYDKGDVMHARTIDIAYIGKYKEPTKLPTALMYGAAIDLIKFGVYEGFIYKRYSVSDLDFNMV